MPMQFNPIIFGSELVISTIIAMLCFIVYFKTKDVFHLTKHKGIGFFRKTFLVLGIAYFFRLLMMLFRSSKHKAFGVQGPSIFPSCLVIVSYLSTIAIMYLFLSTSSKKIRWKHTELTLHLIAVAIAIVAFITKEPLIVIICQAIILIFTAIFSFKIHKHSKKFSKLFVIYILLFFFWITGLIPLTSRRFLPHELTLFTQLIALAIFVAILYKVHKRLK
jgi:hypothetical protein